MNQVNYNQMETGNEIKGNPAGSKGNLAGSACFSALLILAGAMPSWAQDAPAPAAEAPTAAPSAPAPAEQPATVSEDAGGEALSDLQGKVTSLEESFLETKTTVDKLAKIKLSGYVQAQWQYADSMGQSTVAGGNFPATSQERMMVRRGRLKTTYEAATSRYVLQIDVIPTGVSLKDAYATVMEPWLKAFSGTFGVFDRPFGFEISYSSSSRESPERSRVFQRLFPGERDLGAKLEFQGHEQLGFLQYFNAKGGLFTGMGGNALENDNNKDFIGRVGFTAPFYDLNLAVDGGFSTYLGKVTDALTTRRNEMGSAGGNPAWVRTNVGPRSEYDRNVMGVDGQLYYDIPVIGGISLRGEYLWGELPSSSRSDGLWAGAAATGDTNGVYQRPVAGWYVTAVQNLGTRLQAMVKYDVWDPNTEATGDDIGRLGSNFSPNDVAIATLGLGGLFHWDEQVRFTLYYDMVRNEEVNPAATGSLAPWKKDLNDNLWTFRMQVKF